MRVGTPRWLLASRAICGAAEPPFGVGLRGLTSTGHGQAVFRRSPGLGGLPDALS
jgi:hypothetical protein